VTVAAQPRFVLLRTVPASRARPWTCWRRPEGCRCWPWPRHREPTPAATSTAPGGDPLQVTPELTAMSAGAKKSADTTTVDSSRRLHEAAQEQVHRNPEVEERSRWRWASRRLGVSRSQTVDPSEGPGHAAGPLSTSGTAPTRANVSDRHRGRAGGCDRGEQQGTAGNINRGGHRGRSSAPNRRLTAKSGHARPWIMAVAVQLPLKTCAA